MNFPSTRRKRSGATKVSAPRSLDHVGLDSDMDSAAADDEDGNRSPEARQQSTAEDMAGEYTAEELRRRQSPTVVVAPVLDVIVENSDGSILAVEVFSTLPTAATVLSLPFGPITVPALEFQSGSIVPAPTQAPAVPTSAPVQNPPPVPVAPGSSSPSLTVTSSGSLSAPASSVTPAPVVPTSHRGSNSTSTAHSGKVPTASTFRTNGTATAGARSSTHLHGPFVTASGSQTTFSTRAHSSSGASSSQVGIIASGSLSTITAAASSSAPAAASSTAAATVADAATSPSPNTPAIAGGVVGGVAGISLLFVILFFLWRWRQRKQLSAPRQLSSAADTERPDTGRSDAAMAQNSAAPALGAAAFMRSVKRASGQTASTAPSERGFQKISGRKINSVLLTGGDGYGNPAPGSPSGRGRFPVTASSSIGSYYNIADNPYARDSDAYGAAGPGSHVSSMNAAQGSAFQESSVSAMTTSNGSAIPPPAVPERRNPGLRVAPLFSSSPSPPPNYMLGESPPRDDDVVIHVRPGPARQLTHSPGFVTPPMSPASPPPRSRMRQDPIGRSLASLDGSRDSRGSRFAEDIR